MSKTKTNREGGDVEGETPPQNLRELSDSVNELYQNRTFVILTIWLNKKILSDY